MAVVNRDKTNLSIDKRLAIVSTILISVATIGFLFINYYIEPEIDKLKDDNYGYKEKQMLSLDFISKSNSNMKFLYILDGHYHIIKLLDSKNKNLLDSIEEKELQILKGAVYYALNSAISSEQIDDEGSETLFDEIGSLKSKKELLDKYTCYNIKGARGTGYLDGIIEKKKNDILGYKSYKNILLKICLIFQLIGVVFAIVSLVHKK